MNRREFTTCLLSCLTAFTTAAAFAAQPETAPGALREPLKSVLTEYEKIDNALVKDSTEGVTEHARAIAKAVREDKGKTLSLTVAERAEKLAGAGSLKAARVAFKPLSDSLIVYLAENGVKSTGFREAYCPMEKAAWLQTGSEIQNPYMGKSMPSCGEFKRKF